VSPAQTDGRRGRRPRNRALCCECGEVRTVARSYSGRKPRGFPTPPAGTQPWCTWLRCSHCGAVTLHAVIGDHLSQQWSDDGCDREQHNHRTDRNRRRIERRIAALTSEGIAVIRFTAPEDMQLDHVPVEVVQYDDHRGTQLHICASATPSQLLRGIEAAEDVIDEPTKLGPWNDTPCGRWRGVALDA